MRKAAKALEWGRFLELAEQQARTEPGKGLLRALNALSAEVDPSQDGAPPAWAQNLDQARLMQHETRECSQLLDRDALWGPLTDLVDPLAALERLERGSVLEIVELGLIRSWLYAV